MKLIDYIMGEKKEWALQIFQNVLSMCGMIPLRLYDLNKVDKEWKDFYESMGEVDISRLGKDPIKVWPELKTRSRKKIEDLDLHKPEAPWLTLPSYPLPLWEEAMKAKELLSCKTAYIYYWLKGLIKNEMEDDTRLIIKDFLMVGCKKLDIPGKELFLIAGPVLYFADEGQTGQVLYEKILKPSIDYFAKWTQGSSDEMSNLEKVRMMEIMGTLRPFLDERNFKDRLEKAAKAFEGLLLCQWPGPEILRRCMCRELARNSWVLQTTAANAILSELIGKNPKENFTLENIRVIFPILAHKSDLTENNCYLLKPLFKDKKWHLEIIPVQEDDKVSKPKIESIEKEKSSQVEITFLYRIKEKLLSHFKKTGIEKEKGARPIKKVEDYLVYFCQWLDKRLNSMEIAYAQEKLIFFEQWFRQEFGLLAARVEEERPLEAIFMKIAGEIAQFLAADQCDIYRYNNEKESLEIVGCYPSKKNTDPAREDMSGIGENNEMRKRSISYRVIDKKEPRFCRAAIEKNGNLVFEPGDEEIIVNPGFIVRSVVSVPLIVLGRVFGVMEISGRSPFQFRWENLQLLRRISGVISPLIYETLIFHSLADLTKNILQFEMGEEEKYRQICEKMRELFMAYAAVLWHPDRENINHYVPVGWSLKRSDFFKFTELKEKTFFNIKDPECLYNLAINTKGGTRPLTINIEGKLKDESWYKNKPHRQWLKNKEIKEVTHLAIRHSHGDTLILTLYYRRKGEGLNKPWLQVIDFISYHTALLLETLMSQRKWEQGVRNIIHHELKQKVGVILSRTDDIYRFLWKHAPGSIRKLYMGASGAKSKIDLVFQDIKSYSLSLSYLLDILQDPENFEKLKRSYTHPLHYVALKQKQDFDSKEEKTLVNLKRMFNEVFMNTWEIRRDRDLSYTYDGPDDGPFLLMERDHLGTILNNLVDNAVKYAIPETSIDAKVSVTDYSLEFKLSNFAESIEEYEEYSIFNENVRGSNSVDKNGQGQGLYLARLYCELYEGELALEIDRSGDYPLFTFLVSFPKKILKTNPIDKEEKG